MCALLVAAWAAREAEVAARELDAEPELLVEPEPDPAVACVRACPCVQAGQVCRRLLLSPNPVCSYVLSATPAGGLLI